MKFIDIVIIAVILLVLGIAAACIFRAKKQGKKCIGCPHSDSCSCNCEKSH